MMKFSGILLILLFFTPTNNFAQDRVERQHRIKKSQFPTIKSDLTILGNKLKKLRYYKEVDSSKTTFSMKFKMGRLHYHIDYNKSGELINSGFRVKEVDVPEETLAKVQKYLSQNFEKAKIRRLWQEYPVQGGSEAEHFKTTSQNLIWFDAEGNLKRIRKSLPADHDRVLY